MILRGLQRGRFCKALSGFQSFYYIFIISQLWLTSHLRSTVGLLETGTPGTSREIYSEDVDGETRTHNPSVIHCSSH